MEIPHLSSRWGPSKGSWWSFVTNQEEQCSKAVSRIQGWCSHLPSLSRVQMPSATAPHCVPSACTRPGTYSGQFHSTMPSHGPRPSVQMVYPCQTCATDNENCCVGQLQETIQTYVQVKQKTDCQNRQLEKTCIMNQTRVMTGKVCV